MEVFTSFSLNKNPACKTSAVGTTLPLHTYGMPNFQYSFSTKLLLLRSNLK